MVSKLHAIACYLLGGAGVTGFESHWGRISVAVLVAYPAMLNL